MTATAHRGKILHVLKDPGAGDHEAVEFFEDGLLIVDEQGHVDQIGPWDGLQHHLGPGIQLIDHKGKLLIPGFIDTHIHLPQGDVIARYGTQLLDWLERYTFPAELKFADQEHASEQARQFLNHLLANGTTTAMVFGSVHAVSADEFFKACQPLGLRMICGKVLMDRHAPDDLCDTPDTGYQESAVLIEQWHDVGRLGYAVTPRFAPTSTPQQLLKAGELLQHYPGVFMQTHLSENLRECEWVRELFPDSCDYLDVYDRAGLLSSRSVFAHGIHLSDRELGVMARSHSSVSHCPCSNLFIGSGLFNLSMADDHGVTVSLGSDVGGGDSYSMMRVINEAYKVQQLQEHNLHPFRALYLATLAGARVLGLDSYVGNLIVGKEADFVVLDIDATPVLKHRASVSDGIEDLLFALLMLGDERLVKQTWSMGRCVWQSQTAQ